MTHRLNILAKKLILMLAIAVFSFESFSQQNNPAPSLAKQNYLKKSKNQKTTASILLGTGMGLVIIGAAIPKGEEPPDFIPLDKNLYIKAAFYTVGTLSMLVSIPFFTASGKNGKRAAAMSFNNMRMPQIKNSGMVYKTIPALSIRINL